MLFLFCFLRRCLGRLDRLAGFVRRRFSRLFFISELICDRIEIYVFDLLFLLRIGCLYRRENVVCTLLFVRVIVLILRDQEIVSTSHTVIGFIDGRIVALAQFFMRAVRERIVRKDLLDEFLGNTRIREQISLFTGREATDFLFDLLDILLGKRNVVLLRIISQDTCLLSQTYGTLSNHIPRRKVVILIVDFLVVLVQ